MAMRGETACTTWRLLAGEVRLDLADGRVVRARSGDWVFLDPFLERSHRFSRDAVLLSVRFHLLVHGTPVPLAVPEATAPDALLDDLLLAAGRALAEARDAAALRPGDLAAQCRAEAAFQHWLALWHGHRGTPPWSPGAAGGDHRLAALATLLANQVGAGPTDYAPLRRATGLSRSQVDRLCVAGLGMTPRRWRERATLAEAQRELVAGHLALKELAARLRFVDPAHFGRWFRAHTGRTPADFRRTLNR